MTAADFQKKWCGGGKDPYVPKVMETFMGPPVPVTVEVNRVYCVTEEAAQDFVRMIQEAAPRYKVSEIHDLPVGAGHIWYAVYFDPPTAPWLQVHGATDEGEATASVNIGMEIYSYFDHNAPPDQALAGVLADIDWQLANNPTQVV